MAKHANKAVKGHDLPPPRVTLGGILLGVKYLALPILGILLALDVIFYLIVTEGFNSCYGILCAFE